MNDAERAAAPAVASIFPPRTVAFGRRNPPLQRASVRRWPSPAGRAARGSLARALTRPAAQAARRNGAVPRLGRWRAGRIGAQL